MALKWCTFNGQGTPTIFDQSGVTSLTDNAAADYTVNFTDAFTDENYVVAGSGKFDTGDNDFNVPWVGVRFGAGNPAVGSTRIGVWSSGGGIDWEYIAFAAVGPD